MTFSTEQLRQWLADVPNDLKIPFTKGPEVREFMDADVRGSVSRSPAGEGVVTEEGALDQAGILILVSARKEQYEQLERSIYQIDAALRSVNMESLWGTLVNSVERIGTISSTYEEPERESFVATYLIETGL